jgi:hypothetical protein
MASSLQKAVKEKKPPVDTYTPLGGFFCCKIGDPVTEERAKRKLALCHGLGGVGSLSISLGMLRADFNAHHLGLR